MKTQTLSPTALLPRLADATGGVVVCIATGPSLTQADVDYCQGKATVIAVNDAHRMAPWADVLYSSDRYWWKFYGGVRGFAGLKVTIEHSPTRKPMELLKLAPDMVIFRNTGHQGIETDPDGIRTGSQGSGGAAVNVAVHLGAKKIILLGYDCGMPGSKRHFFGDHPQGLSNSQQFPHWRRAFEVMAKPLEDLGIAVLNCSRSTSINAFACASLQEAL